MSGADRTARPPIVADRSALVELADGVWVLPDRDRTPHVPNVGIVVGERAALVIESGIGYANADKVLEIARTLAGDRPLYLTITHFHPEHGFGAKAIADAVTIVYNRAQRDELRDKGPKYLELFRTFGPTIAEALDGVEFVEPDLVYGDSAELDLGGRVVRLMQYGPAHTRGDQVVHLAEEGIVFSGDLIEERFFSIMDDGDAHGSSWIAALERLEELRPRVVVPGHGAIGDGGLVAVTKECLVLHRDRVHALRREGRSLAEIVAIAEPELLQRYPDWDNREWVGAALEHFHAELSSTCEPD
jgi:glyoxylase-like metal-dependent hydrolase (beta-lactamase superfamily II)